MMLESDQKIVKFFKDLIPYIAIIIAVVLFRSYIATPVEVEGKSMYSTLDNGEILILNKLDKDYKRFDVIVFRNKNDKLIKRVIGLPGEIVEYKDNKLYIDGKYVKEKFLINNQTTYDFKLEDLGYKKIPEGYYFVLGDNRTNSTDSRLIGLISNERIYGKASFRIFPFTKFGTF